MYGTNMRTLRESHNRDAYPEEHTKHTNSEKPANLDESPFPCVESVLSDIDAYLETRGLVA